MSFWNAGLQNRNFEEQSGTRLWLMIPALRKNMFLLPDYYEISI